MAREGVHASEIKGSRFWCAPARAPSEQAARDFVPRIHGRHPATGHNCFAHVIGRDGRLHRASYDGEPGGTAGTPMLQVLLGREVCGPCRRHPLLRGAQLGAGGLARAYGGAVSAALDEIGTVERRRLTLVTVTTDHRRAGRLENGLRAAGRTVRDITYSAEVTPRLGIPEADLPVFRCRLAVRPRARRGCETDGSAFVDVQCRSWRSRVRPSRRDRWPADAG